MTLPSSGPLSLNDIQGEFGGSNPIGINEYYAGGGLVPAGTSGTYGAVPTSGQISIQNFYGTSNFVPVYIEDVFSTYLYTGNSSTQTITNGIDLAGKGGLVWTKSRSATNESNILFDTVRGVQKYIATNKTNAQITFPAGFGITAFLSTGYTYEQGDGNQSGFTYASWTFRKQPKFFDVVTYTGNGTTNDVAHALGSVPGFVVIKKTSTTSNWYTLNRDSSGTYVQGYLNTTGSLPQVWTSANTSNYLTSTTLKISALATITAEDMNASGTTYVAYLFAHNAGGFGLTGTDNVISCGSFTTDGSEQATVTLGYEPQWVLMKNASSVSNWILVDNMRGMSVSTTTSDDARLFADTSGAEARSNLIAPTATGFVRVNGGISQTWIYIAIRRGPMKTPTSGTSVFLPQALSNDNTTISTGFTVDLVMNANRAGGALNFNAVDRLRGGTPGTNLAYLVTSNTNAEGSYGVGGGTQFATQNGFSSWMWGAANTVFHLFRRAPGFFDEVCYTGNGSPTTVTHNLGVAPELIITKGRSSTADWYTYSQATGKDKWLLLSADFGTFTSTTMWNNTDPTATQFQVGAANSNPGVTYVAYLFASCPGVSKIGSYSGTGATQTINCGFTGGARFVLIKRTDSTGNWWVWDTARGMVAGTDPRLPMNTTTIEANANWVYTDASGFQIVTTDATVNASGGTYIYLAIA